MSLKFLGNLGYYKNGYIQKMRLQHTVLHKLLFFNLTIYCGKKKERPEITTITLRMHANRTPRRHPNSQAKIRQILSIWDLEEFRAEVPLSAIIKI